MADDDDDLKAALLSGEEIDELRAHPHDWFFRRFFGRPEVASDFFHAVLEPATVEALDWETLEVWPTRLVDAKMREIESDLIFSIRRKDTREAVVLNFLWEHQSTVDRTMPLRLLGYMQGIWGRVKEESEVLPEIIPVVLYQGTRKWTAARSFAGMFAERKTPGTSAFLPDFEYLLIDLKALSEEELLRMEQAWLGMSLMRAVAAGDVLGWMVENVERLRILFEGDGASLNLNFVIGYAVKVELPEKHSKMKEVMTTISTETGEKAKSILDHLLEEGEKKGRLESAVLMLAKGFEPEIVADTLGLPLEQVRELQSAE